MQLGGEKVERFLDQTAEIGLQLKKIEMKMVIGQILVGQIHTRRGSSFLYLLFALEEYVRLQLICMLPGLLLGQGITKMSLFIYDREKWQIGMRAA